MNVERKPVAIKLGGSVAFPDGIDRSFVESFSHLLREETEQGRRCIVVVGGGGVARRYQEALCALGDATAEQQDWVGILATKLNAFIFHTLLADIAHPLFFDARGKIESFEDNAVIIGTVWQPGWSTDYVTARIAADLAIPQLLVLGNVSHVYRNFGSEKSRALEEIQYDDYLAMISEEWKPGMNVPVDPIAARCARDENLELIVANGSDLENVRSLLRGDSYTGTRMYH